MTYHTVYNKIMDRAFTLTAYEPVEDNNGAALCWDGASIEIRSVFCGVFSNVNKAEKCIKHMVSLRNEEIKDGWSGFNWFGFSLVENWIDETPKNGRAWPCTFKSFRTYLGDGSLNCFSDTDEACEKKFKGAKRRSRFKAGDFAWILRKGKAVPTLIEKEAMTREEWKKSMKRGVYGDFTDDSGIDFPFDCKGHDHTFSPLLFPLSSLDCKISKEAKAAMRKSRTEWLKTGI